ncbi:AidA/PixA family protein [Pseudomonas sp. CAU 1711]|uniref:AidA/PixA family protein n=1 Tax=Pseudomonas sp. CAU 1711 TaxID=3140356 RepID=UPI0032617F5F
MTQSSQPGAVVRTVNPTANFDPQSAVTIAVDTAYVVSMGGGSINTGVYMFDNRLTNGSSGEGTLELNSRVNLGDLVGFEVVPINPNSNDTVSITGFQVSSGSVFGSTGYPIQDSPDGSYWVGQAINANAQVTTYQIQIKVTTGGIRPASYYVTWDPFIRLN